MKAMARSYHSGVSNPNSVLTPKLVAEARRFHKLGFGYGWIAQYLGVKKACVQKVLTGRTWKAKQTSNVWTRQLRSA